MSITRGIVGCWSPSLGASGYLLRDVAGRRNATLTNMDPGTDWEATPHGLMLDFVQASQQEAIINMSPTITLSNGGTLSCWSRYATGASLSASVVVSFGHNSPARFFYITYVANRTFSAGISSGTQDYYTDGLTTVAANTLHHAVFTWIDGTIRLYVNGREDRVTNLSAGFTLGLLSQGSVGRLVNYPYFANCKIGECAIWDRGMTAPEIAELYRRGNGWLGRELTGMNQRRTYAKKLGNRRRRLLCGGMT